MKSSTYLLSFVFLFLCFSSRPASAQYQQGNMLPSVNNNDLWGFGLFNPKHSSSIFYQIIQETSLDLEVTEPIYVNLYQADLSLINRFELKLPAADAQLNSWAGGLDYVSSTKNDTLKKYLIYKYSVYDSAFVAQFTDENWSVFVGVLDEKGDSLFTVLSNFHGFETFEVDGKTKLAVNRTTSKDTAFYENGWYNADVFTGRIYDLSTGDLELQMPHGIMYQGITFEEGQRRILGRNNNITTYYEEIYKDHDLMLYNLDGSFYKTAVDSLSNYKTGEFYYLSSVDTFCMKEKYSQSVYSLPDYEELVYGDILYDSRGLAKLVDYNDSLVRIYNEDMSLYKHLSLEQDAMHSVVWVSMHDIVSDDKIEIVCECPNGGLQIYNEDGDLIFDNWDLKIVDDYDNTGGKVVLRFPDETYGRLLTSDMNDYDHFISYYKVGLIPVYAQLGDDPSKGSVELLVATDGGFVPVETAELIQGGANFTVGEGKYALRYLGEQLEDNFRTLNTYYPGALLWENADIVAFNTTAMESLVIDVQSLDLNPLPGASGSISGSIRVLTSDAAFRSTSLPSYDLYLVASSDHSQVKSFTTSNAQGVYVFNQVPVGSYAVLLNVEGKAMTSVNAVVLSSAAEIIENVDYEITDEGIVAVMQNSIEKIRRNKESVYLVNQGNTLLFAGLEGSIDLRLIDLSGRVLLQTKTNSQQVDVSGIQTGVYLLELRLGSEKRVLKFSKP